LDLGAKAGKPEPVLSRRARFRNATFVALQQFPLPASLAERWVRGFGPGGFATAKFWLHCGSASAK